MDDEHRYENVFSPEGTLLQVEYALEAAKKGRACVALIGRECIVLAASKHVPEKLFESKEVSSVFVVSAGLVGIISGLPADTQYIMGKVRKYAADSMYDFGFGAKPDIVCRKMADHWQRRTQRSGERLDGVTLALVGYDRGAPRIYYTDVSGTILSYRAVAFGEGGVMVQKKLEKIYKEEVGEAEAVELALAALSDALGSEYLATDIEVACVKDGMKEMHYLTLDEIDAALVRIAERD
jgi:20S proteasome alpha/beta subunit